MATKKCVVRIQKVEETHFGKILSENPAEQTRHDRIVKELREAAQEEVEVLERSERLTWNDLHVPTFHCS